MRSDALLQRYWQLFYLGSAADSWFGRTYRYTVASLFVRHSARM
jgi:hypothetical protein